MSSIGLYTKKNDDNLGLGAVCIKWLSKFLSHLLSSTIWLLEKQDPNFDSDLLKMEANKFIFVFLKNSLKFILKIYIIYFYEIFIINKKPTSFAVLKNKLKITSKVEIFKTLFEDLYYEKLYKEFKNGEFEKSNQKEFHF